MKYLVDFDGVWTDVAGQADAVRRARVDVIVETTAWHRDDVCRCLDAVDDAIREAPTEHGWRYNGRITAFADEDPFLRHQALVSGLASLAAKGHPACRRLVAALEDVGHHDLTAFASDIFMSASKRFLEQRGHELRAGAAEILQRLASRHKVIFCTNFTPDAVVRSWRLQGIALSAETDPGAPIRIRGLARKQVLSETPQRVVFGGREVFVDRPHYIEVVLQERPDVVVGDVFSLDLATPLSLARTHVELESTVCLLLKSPHTPEWAARVAAAGQWPNLRLARTLEDLLEPVR